MSGRSMNLMDLLSNDSTTLQQDPQLNGLEGLYDNTQDAPDLLIQQEINPSMIFYIPTKMSQLQKDMSEAVVQMFSSVLQSELFPQRARSNINSLLSGPDDAIIGPQDPDTLHRAKLISLIYNQLLTISMHPSLVVDHFISKGLLLSSTKAGLCSISGKLSIFNEIVDTISEEYEVEAPSKDYNLLVIAKSVKELELIEGLVIGKKLCYVNVSTGKKLFEESKEPIRSEKEAFIDDDQFVEYKQKSRRFASRRVAKNGHTSKIFTLHLITSGHLCSSFTSNIDFNLMVSFDSELDTSSSSIELLRKNADFHAAASSQSHIPILIPLPVYSVEHISRITAKAEPDFGSLNKDADINWRLLVLRRFVGNRYRIFETHETLNDNNCGIDACLIHDLVLSRAKYALHSPHKWLDKYTKLINLELPSDKLLARLNANYLRYLESSFGDQAKVYRAGSETTETHPIENYDDYKRYMAYFLSERATEINKLKANALNHIVPRFRTDEEKRQAEIDYDEEQVGDNYRKLRKLNEELAVVEKRFTRVENEVQKSLNLMGSTQKLLDFLDTVLKNTDDDKMTDKLDEQTSLMKQLENEKALLLNENRYADEEIDRAREQYQQTSTSALCASDVLKGLKKKHELLKRRADGPGMSVLPALARENELRSYETKLHHLEQETSFLEDLYTSRIDKVIKERSLAMETTPVVSTSRSNNRTSRAPTPLQAAKKT